MRAMNCWILTTCCVCAPAYAEQIDLNTADAAAQHIDSAAQNHALARVLPRWWASLESYTLSWFDSLDASPSAPSTMTLPSAAALVLPSLNQPTPGGGEAFGYEQDPLLQAATFRSAGSLYFKGKAGYLNLEEQYKEDLFAELSFTEMVTEIDRGRAIGLGAGYRIGRGERLEFEYVVNKKEEQVFNVGYTF